MLIFQPSFAGIGFGALVLVSHEMGESFIVLKCLSDAFNARQLVRFS
jgi:hypothetical protein